VNLCGANIQFGRERLGGFAVCPIQKNSGAAARGFVGILCEGAEHETFAFGNGFFARFHVLKT